jgi:hypothetical protein
MTHTTLLVSYAAPWLLAVAAAITLSGDAVKNIAERMERNASTLRFGAETENFIFRGFVRRGILKPEQFARTRFNAYLISTRFRRARKPKGDQP